MNNQKGVSKISFFLFIVLILAISFYGYKHWYPLYNSQNQIKKQLIDQEEQSKINLEERIKQVDFNVVIPNEMPQGYYLSEDYLDFLNKDALEEIAYGENKGFRYAYVNPNGSVIEIYQRILNADEKKKYPNRDKWDSYHEIKLNNEVTGYLVKKSNSDSSKSPDGFELNVSGESQILSFFFNNSYYSISNNYIIVGDNNVIFLKTKLLSLNEIEKIANSIMK